MVQMRKVVLADSLGETSVSVENVSYVICSGKRRVYRFDPVKKVFWSYYLYLIEFNFFVDALTKL